MTYTLTIFILFCGLFKVYLSLPKTTNEAELKKLGNYQAKLKSHWTKEDELIRIANELVRLDECEEAIPFFTKVINNDSKKRTTYYKDRGNCYSRMGKWSEAYSDFKKHYYMQFNRIGNQTEKAAAVDHRELCSDLTYRKKDNEAILCYTEAIKMDPSEMLGYKLRADCYKRLENYDLAELDYRETLAKFPKGKGSRIYLIQVLFLQGKSEEAVVEMRLLNDIDLGKLGDEFCNREETYRQGILCYTEASNQSYLDPEYYLKRGDCYEKLNEMDEAINDYRSALQKKPNDELILEKLILALFKSKQIDEASKVIHSLTDDDLKRFEERFAGSYNYEWAIPVFTEAIERNPDDASKYNARGRCYLGMGNLDSALTDFERAIKLDPNNTGYALNQTKALFKIGRSAEAVEKLVVLDVAQLQSVGDALIKDSKYQEAFQCFTKAIKKNPDNPYSHERAAECYWLNGDFEKAKLETERAINLLPPNTQRRIDLGIMWCEKLVKAGKFPEARLDLKNLEMQYGRSGRVAIRAADLREEMIRMEQEMRAPPSSA